MKVIERLKTGNFNTMSQEWQPDGSVIITLTKRGEGKVYKMKVKNLYSKKEKVEWEKVESDTGHI